MYIVCLIAAALRIVTRKRGTSVPASELSPEEASYWALSDAERAAEDAE